MPPIRQPTARDLLLVIALGAVWGSAFAAIKIAVEEIGPALLVLARVMIAFAVIGAWMAWKGSRFPTTLPQWIPLTVMGVLNTVAPFYLIAWAEQYTDSGITALIMGSGPLLALLIAHFTTGDDRFTIFKVAGVALGFTAVAIVVGSEVVDGGKSELLPALAIFLANLCYVISGAMIRHIPDTSVESMAGSNLLVAMFAMIPLLAVTGVPPVTGISLAGVGALLYLGIVSTGFAYLLRFHIATTVGVSYMTLAAYVMPIAGVAIGAAILGEAISPVIVLALMLTVAGLLVARIRR